MWGSLHIADRNECGVYVTQTPFTQRCVPTHCLPHRPQCWRLNCISTHLPSQHVSVPVRPGLAALPVADPGARAAEGAEARADPYARPAQGDLARRAAELRVHVESLGRTADRRRPRLDADVAGEGSERRSRKPEGSTSVLPVVDAALLVLRLAALVPAARLAGDAARLLLLAALLAALAVAAPLLLGAAAATALHLAGPARAAARIAAYADPSSTRRRKRESNT